jgi:starvation-inducible DNA-binding protein
MAKKTQPVFKATSAPAKLRLTGIALDAENRGACAHELALVLADLSDLYSQCKHAHWNVRGENFYSLHLFFDALADVVQEPIDAIAERIVALGGVAQGTIRQSGAASRVPEFPAAARDYISELAARFTLVANHVREGIDVCDGAGDAGSADLLTGISRELDKALWMLESHVR